MPWKKSNYSVVKLPLEHETAIRLSHTRPNQWIGTLSDGRRIMVLGAGNKVKIYTGENLNDVLAMVKKGKGHQVSVPVYSGRHIPTDMMIKATGLKLGCEPKEKVIEAGLPEAKQ